MRKIKLFPSIADIEELSGLKGKDAKNLYRKKYCAVIFSRDGLVGVCLAILVMVAFRVVLGDFGRVVSWFLGPYVMYVYVFNKIEFRK